MMAKSLAEQIAAMSMIIGILMGVVLGAQIDGNQTKITPYYLGMFAFRGLGLICMTTLVTDFETQKGLLIACFIAMTAGTFC